MERLKRDLHAALKTRLDLSIRYKTFLFLFLIKFNFFYRMIIALDVVEGLRYLHGLGLVHRDIKLKNVLVRYYRNLL
jgi:serine/threonine protein kinase